MVLGRMIYFFIPSHSLLGIQASTLAVYFVCLDIASFVVQTIGGLMGSTGNPPDIIQKGIHMYMAGIGLQEFFIVCFSFLAVKFHLTLLKLEKAGQIPHEKRRWRWVLYTLYVSLFLITVRQKSPPSPMKIAHKT